jgi:hypothetical protein
MNYKYGIGDQVIVRIMGKNWDDDHDAESIIVGIADYVENGIPVYTIKTHYDLLKNVKETEIILNEKST